MHRKEQKPPKRIYVSILKIIKSQHLQKYVLKTFDIFIVMPTD